MYVLGWPIHWVVVALCVLVLFIAGLMALIALAAGVWRLVRLQRRALSCQEDLVVAVRALVNRKV